MTFWSYLIQADPLTITTHVFLGIIVACLLSVIFRGDTQEKTFQKIIGGLAVFIVAAISNHPFVIFVSLFIGGLIIASEKFLQSLVAILRSDSKAIPNTLAALTASVDVSPATSEEVENEAKKENEEMQSEGRPSLTSGKKRFLFEERQLIREKIIKSLKEKYKNNFTPNLKLENEYGGLVVDGVIHQSADAGNINLENAMSIVEIEYVHEQSRNIPFEFSIRRALEKIRYLFITKQLYVVFYSKDLSLERAQELDNKLNDLFDGKQNVVFGFYCVREDKEIEPLIVPDLKEHVK